MTRTIELSAEQERALARKAARLGLDIDAYLRRIVERAAEPRRTSRAPGSPRLRRIKREGGYSREWSDSDLQELAADTLEYASKSLDDANG